MSEQFTFAVVTNIPRMASRRYCGYLVIDNWDDWFKYSTMYALTLFTATGDEVNVGAVKIGQFGMKKKQRRPELPDQFEILDEQFFSLGQSEEYYEQLGKLDEPLRNAVVKGLRDVVADPILWKRAQAEDVTEVSLTRSLSAKSIKEQFRRLLEGGARLTSFCFTFTPPKRPDGGKLTQPLVFNVRPESNPPTNVHVLIGRNGVGKTRMLHLMTKSLVGEPKAAAQSGKFASEDPLGDNTIPFAGLVTVSFSAFDDVEMLPEKTSSSDLLRYYYIGLRRNQPSIEAHGRPKTPDRLAKEFVTAVKACLSGPRMPRWKRALNMLEGDPIFKEAEIASLACHDERGTLEERTTTKFKLLSAGHKIVLLTITRLVEVVEEKTLVLIDEPEGHLHPPLLSAFVRSLADLLVNRNGVAIIATHSPVVLQEVPKTCVWMLRRTGEEAVAERPECETFGENVGILTREVFRLEVAQTGFHKMLANAAASGGSFRFILEKFNGELGAEAKAIVQALVATNAQERRG